MHAKRLEHMLAKNTEVLLSSETVARLRGTWYLLLYGVAEHIGRARDETSACAAAWKRWLGIWGQGCVLIDKSAAPEHDAWGSSTMPGVLGPSTPLDTITIALDDHTGVE